GIALHIYAGDANDYLPRDGTENETGPSGGAYGGFSRWSPDPTFPFSCPPGDPHPRCYFFPPPLARTTRSYYHGNASPGRGISTTKYQQVYSFPNNGLGKIWMCPSAQSVGADTGLFLSGGLYGFFCYVMNLDLKLQSSVDNGVKGNSFYYPTMPKFSTMHNTA